MLVSSRYGQLRVPDIESDLIGRSLDRYGEWGWLEAQFVSLVVADGARILDAGAFVGTFGLGLAMARKLGFLCAVEANPQVTPMLRDNLSGNAGCRHAVIEAVVAGPAGLHRIGLGPADNLGATSYAVDGAGDRTAGPALRTATLAELRRQHGPFDLIKLDIEGMERDALLGDAAHLASGTTALWVECNEDRRSLDVARLLLSWNLELTYFAFPSFNPGNVNGESSPLLPWAYEAGLLAGTPGPAGLPPHLQAAGCILRPIRSVGELTDALWHTPRWGAPEWGGATTLPDLAALVGHALCDQRRDAFLAPGHGEPAPVRTVWHRLQDTEAALADARRLLEAERQVREAAEGGLRHAETLVHERVAELQAQRVRKEAAEHGLRTAEVLAFQRADQLKAEQAHHQSTAQALLSASARADRLARDLALAADRADAADRGLARLSGRGLAQLARFGQEREQAAARERTLQAGLDDALGCVAALAKQAAQQDARLQEALHAAECRVLAAQDAAHVIQSSSLWRGLAPLRRLLQDRTRLRWALRTTLHAMIAVRRLRPPG